MAGAPNGSFVVTWSDAGNTMRARVYVNGQNPLTGEINVGSGTGLFDEEHSVAMAPNGTFVAA